MSTPTRGLALAGLIVVLLVAAVLIGWFSDDHQDRAVTTTVAVAPQKPCDPPGSVPTDSYLIAVAPNGDRWALCVGAGSKMLLQVSDEAYMVLLAHGRSALNGVYNVGRDGIYDTGGRNP